MSPPTRGWLPFLRTREKPFPLLFLWVKLTKEKLLHTFHENINESHTFVGSMECIFVVYILCICGRYSVDLPRPTFKVKVGTNTWSVTSPSWNFYFPPKVVSYSNSRDTTTFTKVRVSGGGAKVGSSSLAEVYGVTGTEWGLERHDHPFGFVHPGSFGPDPGQTPSPVPPRPHVSWRENLRDLRRGCGEHSCSVKKGRTTHTTPVCDSFFTT